MPPPESQTTPNTSAPTPHDKLVAEFELDDIVPSTPTVPPSPTPVAAQPADVSTTVPPAAPNTSAPRHTASLVRMALDAGMSQAEIDATSPDALGDVVYQLQRQERQRYQSQPPPATPPPAPKEEEIDWGVDAEGKALTEADYHPAVAKTIRRSHEQDREIKSLKDKLSQREERERQMEGRRSASMLDLAFESLGTRYEKLLGKGPANEMGPDRKAEWKRRVGILFSAGINPSAMEGLSQSQVNQKVREAAEEMFGGVLPTEPAPLVPETEEEKSVRKRKEDWDRAGLHRPTHRERAPANGKEAAAAAVASKMRNMGFDTSAETNDEEDSLDGTE